MRLGVLFASSTAKRKDCSDPAEVPMRMHALIQSVVIMERRRILQAGVQQLSSCSSRISQFNECLLIYILCVQLVAVHCTAPVKLAHVKNPIHLIALLFFLQ